MWPSSAQTFTNGSKIEQLHLQAIYSTETTFSRYVVEYSLWKRTMIFLIKQNVASLFGIVMKMVQGFLILALVFTADGDPYTAVIGKLILPAIKFSYLRCY